MHTRNVIFVPVLIIVAILALLSGGLWWLYQNHNFYRTDDAQITGQMVTVSSADSGQLTTLAVKSGDKVTTGQVVGTVSVPAGTTGSAKASPINITTPISGTVVQESAVQGQTVSPGQTLLTVANLNNLAVTAYVDESALKDIKLNQDVDIKVDAFDETYNGHVKQIVQATAGSFALLPASDPSSGNFTKVSQRVPVLVSLDGSGVNDLVPGLSAEVTIHLHSR